MPNKFSDFRNSNLDNFVEKNKDIVEEFKHNNAGTYNNINQLYNQYSSMSGDAIFNEFLKVANEKKRNGTLNLDYLNNMKSVMFPYLTDEQKKVFNNLLNILRWSYA